MFSNAFVLVAALWACVLPPLLSYNLPPSPTLINQCLAFGAWGAFVLALALAGWKLAGITGVDPNIRQVVDAETNEDEADSKQLVDSIVFWRKPEPYGTVVNPDEEQKRLQENAALGNAPTTGDVPIIERKQKGLLEGLF